MGADGDGAAWGAEYRRVMTDAVYTARTATRRKTPPLKLLGCREVISRASVFVVLVVVFGRRGIELPAVLVAVGDLVRPLELLVVLVLDAERAADVVHAILVRRRVVAAGRFVAYRVGIFPVGIHVAAGHRGTRLRVLALRLTQLGAAGARS